MRYVPCFVLFVIITLIYPTTSLAQEMSPEQAMSVLKETTPILDPWVRLGTTDPAERKATQQLYDSQISAIEVLGKTKNASAASWLILFLNYPAKGYAPAHVFMAPDLDESETEDVKVTRSHWPAFDALLNIPGSSKTLAIYALDARNSPRFRIAALHVLRYANIEEFKAVALKFRQGFPHLGQDANGYLQAIEDGSRSFCGVYPFDPTQ